MTRSTRPLWVILSMSLSLLASSAWAHFPVLIAEPASLVKGETARLEFRFGHPFEAAWTHAARPERLTALTPSGRELDLTQRLGPVDGGKAWRAEYVPDERGDHLIGLLRKGTHDEAAVSDWVKLVLHVSSVQQGWERRLGTPLEIEPLTRPYGLRAGAVFHGRVLKDGEPLGGATVEVEALREQAPDPLPPEELITLTTRTAPDGTFVVNLGEPGAGSGWWVLAATAEGEPLEREGEPLAHELRASLWVPVVGSR